MQALKYNKASHMTTVYLGIFLEELGFGGGKQKQAHIGTANTTSNSTRGTRVLKIPFADYY